MRLQDVPWGPGLVVGSECTQHRAVGEEALRTEGAPSPRGSDGQGGLGGMMAPLSPSLHSTLEEDGQGGQDGESVSPARPHLKSPKQEPCRCWQKAGGGPCTRCHGYYSSVNKNALRVHGSAEQNHKDTGH